MIFSSTHERLTRTSSDLRLLSAVLLPPSPILEAGDFLLSSTSEEIPILLGATAHAYDSSLRTFEERLGLCNVAEEPKLPNDQLDTAKSAKDSTYGGEALFQHWMYEGPGDMHIIAEPSKGRFHSFESPSGAECAPRTVSGGQKNGIHSLHRDLFGGDVGCPNMLSDCSRVTFRKQDDAIRLWDSQVSCPNPMELSTTTTVAAEEELDGDQQVTFATFHTYSTLPTPTFAPPSPSPSADVISPLSSPIIRQRHRRPLERARAVRFHGRPKSPRLQVSEAEVDPSRSAPSSTTYHGSYSRRQLTNSALAVSAHADTHASTTAQASLPSTKHVTLPEELSWLRPVTIELWIDQEGFRAVRPCMQLMGYSPRNRSLHPYVFAENAKSDVTAGVAEFMPMKRETFAFHYATLDSPPTLRMVSVSGDESRDYISRQATLSVKVNGAYTVLGTETFIAPALNSDAHGSHLHNVRLRWKFDYLVGDRKVDGSGKTLPGEKTLTPLTFSCSPYLFHLSQGKKTGLMHIVKKNLAPKLASLKLKPPVYVSSQCILQAPRYLSTVRDATTHARSRSDAFAESGHYSLTKSPLDAGVRGGTMQGVNHAPRTRRRRASSAGENSLVRSENGSGQGGITMGERGNAHIHTWPCSI